jgi:type II secretory pathway pseudopilin PulG
MCQKMKTTINQWLVKAKGWLQDEKGVGLVESLVAVAILGIAAVVFVAALSTESIAVREEDQQVVAQSLAQAQLEYVKSYPYDSGATTYPYVDTYGATYNPNPVTLPEGYTISVEVASIPDTDTDIQKITVTISREGDDILIVEDYKVNR